MVWHSGRKRGLNWWSGERRSLWSLLRGSVGRDLSSIAIPVAFHEPLSLLQRCAEDLEYRRADH